MRAQEQQRILKILQQGLATHTSADAGEMLQVPMEGYTDPEQLALEQTVFFKTDALDAGIIQRPPWNQHLCGNERNRGANFNDPGCVWLLSSLFKYLSPPRHASGCNRSRRGAAI